LPCRAADKPVLVNELLKGRPTFIVTDSTGISYWCMIEQIIEGNEYIIKLRDTNDVG
jgi:hypothetical protein